ncbi:MAG: glycoside hydrolase family 127 protein [Phycisphaerae bacterium]|nr:glycoside hydrolase family 127 protein [Phycisphaerae bacterium]
MFMRLMIVFSLCTAVFAAETKEHIKVQTDRNVIHPFNYEGVELLPGRLHDQYNQVKDFYLKLRNNDILKGFRQRHKSHTPGRELGGAYSDSGLTFGQWLSAYARMYKVTGDTAIKDKVVSLMEEWAKTIDEDGFFGYHNPPHNPGHYIYDKMVGGLVDIYEYTGNENAIKHLDTITTWAEKNLDRSNPFALPSEWYTLNENLYRAYLLTGDKRYYDFGKVWEYNDYWDIFAKEQSPFQDILKSNPKHESYHGYSHVNAFSGASLAYEVTGQRHYLDAVVNGYKFLKETQLFATGGFGPEEGFIVPNSMPEILEGDQRGESNVPVRFHFETACGSWAAFKMSRDLMRFTGDAQYGDWIERLIYNGVGAMPPMNEDGMIMYGSCYHHKGAQKKLFTVWFCCSGTLPIDVVDYHNLIYFHDKDNLYVNLFVPSKVQWDGPDGKVKLTQKHRFPEKDFVNFEIDPEISGEFGVKFRVPLWADKGIKVKVNDKEVDVKCIPGKWATIRRNWKKGDKVSLQFDMTARGEPLPGCITPLAVMCGPVVMVQASAREEEGWLAKVSDLRFPADWLSVGSQVSVDQTRGLHSNQVLRPFYDMNVGEYYQMYFDRWGQKEILPEEMEFKGDWTTKGVSRYSAKPGSSFECKFNGSAIIWEGRRHNNAGIAKIFIDGKEVENVDQYGYTDVYVQRLDQREVPFRYSLSNLGGGEHHIKVTLSPQKNPSSKGTEINIKRLLVFP